MTQEDNQTLDDVCEFIVDCLHKTAPIQEEGYPSIRTPNVGRGRLLLAGVNRVSEAVYDEWTRRATPLPGDLIMAREAPAGNVAIIKEGQTVCLGQRTVHLRPDQTKVDPDFLCYFLLAPKQQGALLAGETGATAGHVNMRDIRRLKVGKLPEKETQKKAAKIISTYDDLIENNQRRIALLEDAARMLYREWFVHFRFPAHEHVKIIDGLPDGWESVPPKEFIAQHIGGGWGQDEPKGKDSEPAFVIRGTDMPLVEKGDISTVGLRFHNLAALSSRVLRPYDVIFEVSGGSSTQPIARTLILTPERIRQFDKAIICASFCKKFSFRSEADAVFFYYHVRVHRDRGEILVYQKESASSLKNFNFEAFMNGYRIRLPPFSLRRLFFEAADCLIRQQAVLAAQNELLNESRDTLLPRLMTGELAV